MQKIPLTLNVFRLFFAIFLVLLLHLSAHADVANVEITGSPDASYPVSTTFKVRLSARTSNEPKPTDECGTGGPRGWSGPSWTWSSSSGTTIRSVAGQPPNVVDLEMSFGAVGPKSVTATANVSYTSNCGSRSGSATKTVDGFQIVGIGQLQWKQGGTYVNASSLSDICDGATLYFKAVANPVGAPWPSGYPKWSGSATSGTGETKNGTYSGDVEAGDRTATVTCGNSKTATIGVVANPTFPANNATATKFTPTTYRESLGDNVYGMTYPEDVKADITACHDGSKWHAIVTGISGRYSLRYRLLSGQQEITTPGPDDATSCAKASELASLGYGAVADNPGDPIARWYVLLAVLRHEEQHELHFLPTIKDRAGQIENKFEEVTIPDTGQTKEQAINEIKASTAYSFAQEDNWNTWTTALIPLVNGDHADGGTAQTAEIAVVAPILKQICDWRAAQNPPLTGCTVCGD